MSFHPLKVAIPGIAGNCPVFDIVSNPSNLIKFRSALRAWFMSHLTQTDEHVNYSTLAENCYFYKVLQEWLDWSMLATVATYATH